MSHDPTDPSAGSRPILRLVRGNPEPEEIAAIVAVLTTRAATAAAAAESTAQPRPLWRDRTALLRAPLMPRRGAWRASGLPTHR